jgi:phenylpropionate dioxygenase-like ring-hydroxylating dioxygenase large terminal subunit
MHDAAMESPSHYPRGWYRVALSDELPVRPRPLTVRAFGGELVLFRDRAGRARAVDPYCPHLGAHLGDGCVDDGRLRCPFHGWCFDGDGRCVEIPFASRIPARAQLSGFLVREQDGVVFVWNGSGAPDFEVPAVPELATGGWSRPLVFKRLLRGRLVDAKENIVDLAHFPVVHAPAWRRFTRPPRALDRRAEGAHLVFEVEAPMRFLGRDLVSRFRFDLHGPGVDEVRVQKPVPLLYRFLTTPIDEHTVELVQLAYAPRLAFPGATRLLRRLYQLSFRSDLPGDARIWARKRYVPQPVLSEVDGPIPWFRSWWSQFTSSTQGAVREVIGGCDLS